MLSGSKMNKQDRDSDSQAASETTTTAPYSAVPFVPEDIWCHIHSLMPMREAARAACVSRSFLRSWRCRPDLILDSSTRTLHFMNPEDDLITTISSILRNHSGIGLKRLMLNLSYEYDTSPHVKGWLKAALRPGIEELQISLEDKKCKFPCSVLSDDEGVRNSIRRLRLESCTFRPTPELGPLRSLTKITLESVRITGDELECLLSNSPALEKMDVYGCSKISSLKVPSVLQRLRCLYVTGCGRLEVIENRAPNLSTFEFGGDVIGETKQIKKLTMNNSACHCRVELPSIMPNLERLRIHSNGEDVSTPMLPSKFLHLKHLTILIFGVTDRSPYDCFSLVSFLDASPSLQTLHINCSMEGMESVSGSPSDLRQLPEHCRNDRLWSVSIVPFSSAKSLVELTRSIVKSAAVSLKHITLDTLRLYPRCSGGDDSNKFRDHPTCGSLSQAKLDGASRAATAIRDYIEDVVPDTAELTVLGPCERCHSGKRQGRQESTS